MKIDCCMLETLVDEQFQTRVLEGILLSNTIRVWRLWSIRLDRTASMLTMSKTRGIFAKFRSILLKRGIYPTYSDIIS
jgi:hypothetical protein